MSKKTNLAAEANNIANQDFDSQRDMNMYNNCNEMICLLDDQQYLTLLEPEHGTVLLDQPFQDIMPNNNIIMTDLEKYNVDTNFPITCDYRSSKNSEMYAIQKQNTTANDEYKLMKITYQRVMTKNDSFLEHPYLS